MLILTLIFTFLFRLILILTLILIFAFKLMLILGLIGFLSKRLITGLTLMPKNGFGLMLTLMLHNEYQFETDISYQLGLIWTTLAFTSYSSNKLVIIFS